MSEPSAGVVLEGTATFLHGAGACIGGAGIVYHWLKKQWWYLGVALIITIFHGASAHRHNRLRKEAIKTAAVCENCPRFPALRLVQKGVA